ncbi:YUC10 [Symbiodinium pilosum]|uniref:YUC10 protein n=1 Tax=Symbiodinium pilosum TaxID=2952 RepID=A0A812PPA0_SYMPI|nr:YUC10 [Symbiodinium pilosum]
MGDSREQARLWLASFSQALQSRDYKGLAGLFVEKCSWRDLLCFTWDIQTLEGKVPICDMLASVLHHVKPDGWALEAVADADEVITARFIFRTAYASCIGHVRLCGGLCWTMMTAAQGLVGHEEKRGLTRELGGHSAAVRRSATQPKSREEPFVVIVGGSQCGVTLGARLKQLGVPNLVLEKNERPGDAWRHRYDSLRLHFQVTYCEFPYLPFPDSWPKYLTKDQMADWIDIYATVMNVDLWTGSRCVKAEWDEVKSTWTVHVDRHGERVQLQPRHLVIATGLNGTAYIPKLQNQGTFAGVTLHSSQYLLGAPYTGKKAVVVGSGTSAHDICQDLWEHGAEVTMIQRSPTPITRISTHQQVCLQRLYSEEARASGMSTEAADFEFISTPYRLLLEKQSRAAVELRERDADLLQRLEKVGFMLDSVTTNTSNYLASGSGTYLEAGASELIAAGEIKVKTGTAVALGESTLTIDDGTQISADVVVFASGYEPLSQLIADVLGKNVAARLGRIWGLGSERPGDAGPWEGELRNMWKPTSVEGLWLHGGNLLQNRIYSHFLALQLKARHVGIPTCVYKPPRSSHTGFERAGA